jgi:hypothetical protein
MADIPLRIICPIDTGQIAVRLGGGESLMCKHVHVSEVGSEVTRKDNQPRQPTPMSDTPQDHQISSSPSRRVPADCLSCRIIGTGALGATGFYALNQARAHQPGSPVGTRIMAGIRVLFLLGSVARWRT